MIEDQNDQISVILCCGYKLETGGSETECIILVIINQQNICYNSNQ